MLHWSFEFAVKKITCEGHLENVSLTVVLPNCALCLSSAPSKAPESVDGRALSATEAIVWWLPLSQSNIDGYQVSRKFYKGML